MAYTVSSDDIIWGGIDSDMENGTINLWLYLDTDSMPYQGAPVEMFDHLKQYTTYYRDRLKWRIEYDSDNGARARMQINSPSTDAADVYSCDIPLTTDGLLKWHMHTVTWDRATGAIDFYVDGASMGSSTDVIPALSGVASDFVAGQITGPYQVSGTALTAHLAVWKSAVPSSDVTALHSKMTINDSINMRLFVGATGITTIFTNPSNQGGYVTKFDVRGKRLKVYQDNVYTRINEENQNLIGERAESLDMTYQDDPLVGKDAADFLGSFLYLSRTEVQTFSFDAFRNSALEQQALALEPGDRITLVNSHLGISRDFWVQGIEGEIKGPNLMTITMYLLQTTDVNFWKLGVPGYSELEQTTYLSY
jgi:hypothetical protein